MDGARAAACVCQSSCGVPRGISIRTCPIRKSAGSPRNDPRRHGQERGARRDRRTGSWIDERFDAVRAFARRAIARRSGRWSARSAAIVAAIVIGDRTALDAGVQQRLQEAGTFHVIAISGGNIAILAGLMLGLFRLAGVLGRTAMLASIAALTGYGYLVGGGASVDRATLMAVVYLAGRAIDQRSPPLNTLAFVAACLVATQPLSVADPAFVLTFGATLAILVVMPVVARRRFPGVGRGDGHDAPGIGGHRGDAAFPWAPSSSRA